MRILISLLFATLVLGCASKIKGNFVTNSRWASKTADGGEFVIAPGIEHEAALSPSSQKTILKISVEDQEAEVPLLISESDLTTDGQRYYSKEQVGQPYDLALSRQTKMQTQPRRTTSESCTYVEKKTNDKKSGRQWVEYTPVKVDTYLNLAFVNPQTSQRMATFSSHQTRESKMDEDRSSCR